MPYEDKICLPSYQSKMDLYKLYKADMAASNNKEIIFF